MSRTVGTSFAIALAVLFAYGCSSVVPFEQSLVEEVEKAKPKVLSSGGRVLMYTDTSELIAVMKQNARYAGAIGAITMYVMLRRM